MDGVPIPLLPYSLVNQERLILLLDKIQTAVPEEVQNADQILSHKEEIMQEAQRRAQQILQEAKEQAQTMLHESELLKAVHLEAERVRQQVMAELQSVRQQTLDETNALREKTLEEARLIRESGDEYADRVLNSLTKSLDEFQNIAKNAQKQLKKVRVDALQSQHPSQGIASGSFLSSFKGKEPPRPTRQEPVTDPQEAHV